MKDQTVKHEEGAKYGIYSIIAALFFMAGMLCGKLEQDPPKEVIVSVLPEVITVYTDIATSKCSMLPLTDVADTRAVVLETEHLIQTYNCEAYFNDDF